MGGSCRGGVGQAGVGGSCIVSHAGVGWGGSCRGEVDHALWVM